MLIVLDYMLWKPIGRGAFGLVWNAKILCGSRKDEVVAIKIVNLDDSTGQSTYETLVW